MNSHIDLERKTSAPIIERLHAGRLHLAGGYMKGSLLMIIAALLITACAASTTTPPSTSTPEPTSTPTPIPTPTIAPLNVADIGLPVLTMPGPEGALYRLGIGWQEQVAVSPNSRLLALPATTGLYVYTADSLELVWANTDQSFASSAVWSPDSSRVVSLHWGMTISVFDAGDGTRLYHFPVQIDDYYSPVIIPSRDNRQLLVDGRLYDVTSGEELACVDCAEATTVQEYEAVMAFTDENILRAVVSCDEALFCLWQSDTRQAVPYPLAGVREGAALSMSLDGRRVLVRADKAIRLFDVEEETYHRLPELTNLPFGDDYYHISREDIVWAPDGSAFTIDVGEQEYLFRMDAEISIFNWEGEGYSHFVWSPDSSRLLYGNDQTVTLYSVGDEVDIIRTVDGNGEQVLLNNGEIIWKTTFGEGYKGLKSGADGMLMTDVESMEFVSAGWTPENLLMVIPDSFGLLTGESGMLSRIFLFDGATGTNVAMLNMEIVDGFVLRCWDFQWSADGGRLAWLNFGEGVPLSIWDRKTGEQLPPLPLEGFMQMESIALNNQGTQLLVGDSDGDILLFDMESGELIRQVNGDDYEANIVNDLVWSPDGSQFASVDGGTIEPITVWDAETFAPLYTLMPAWEERTSFRTLDWAGDLIAAGVGGNVYVWSAGSQDLLWSTKQQIDDCRMTYTQTENRMAVSDDARYLAMVIGGASQGCDRIGVYDAHSGKLLHTYPGHGTDGITRLAWSPDGRYLSSVAGDGTVIVWDTSLLAPVEIP